MVEPSGPLLEVTGLEAGYGGKRVLNGISLAVEPGEIVALIGHNGAGKSTVLKAIFGLVAVRGGEISWSGEPVTSRRPRELLDRGISYLPQGNRVFPDLTVEENLRVGAASIRNRALVQEALERAFTQFPVLSSRRRQKAATLSGGEKQMLALANAMMPSPRLLLLDEPSLGLAPALVAAALGRLREVSAGTGMTILIVEQKVREVLKIANRVYVLRAGQVSFSGLAADLRDEQALRRVYL